MERKDMIITGVGVLLATVLFLPGCSNSNDANLESETAGVTLAPKEVTIPLITTTREIDSVNEWHIITKIFQDEAIVNDPFLSNIVLPETPEGYVITNVVQANMPNQYAVTWTSVAPMEITGVRQPNGSYVFNDFGRVLR